MTGRKFILSILVASFLGGALALGGYQLMKEDQPLPSTKPYQEQAVKLSNYYSDTSFTIPEGLNFVYAAEKATKAVVHIKSVFKGSEGYVSRGPIDEMFKDFFGQDPGRHGRRPARSFGSGVIISADGYIATNNHVVENADEVEVTLHDNRKYKAKIIGTDPTTDLALIKIRQDGLDYLSYGSSDNIRVGEWVLAVGNPFDLYSTVTAGIVSAKARGQLNILRDRDNLQIESFIQTDAAVNPGNSGGALVNLDGDLVGINTAIATPTGSYAGYSFAVPVSLVGKVVADLMEFGVAQRALLGISILDVNAELAEEYDLDMVEGVYVRSVNPNSAADDAGLEEGDVIEAINGVEVTNVAQLQEQVALNRPGDKIEVTYVRSGSQRTTLATLKSVMGDTEIVERVASLSIEGATFQDVSQDEMEELDIDGGAKIIGLDDGKWKDVGIKEGFVVTSIDKKPINGVDDLRRSLENKRGGTLIEGIYTNGSRAFFGIGW